jgi:hypothetical protein
MNYKMFSLHTTDSAVDRTDTAAHSTMHTRASSLPPPPTSIRLSKVIQALNTLERPQHSSQEQFCVPLVPTDTYWYLSASPELVELVAGRLDGQPAGDER